jgi:hypothetical protein
MKSTELRIGNWVKGIGLNVQWDIEGVKYDFIYSLGQWRHLSVFEPIPLTEEWLLKFRFELINNDYWQSRNSELKLHWTVNKNKMIPEFNEKRLVIGYDFEHVHQLQNLYFALTGEELTIDEQLKHEQSKD